MQDFYYSNGDLLSYNKFLNFVLGNRGCGKTYNFKEWAIKSFLKTGKQFIYVRRYKNELKKIGQFFSDIAPAFPDTKFEVKGKTAFINDKVAGYFVNLSTSAQEKSTAYPNVDKIGYDEFVIDKGNIRYLPNEVEIFLDFIETVFRSRDDGRVICFANAITMVNPYFLYFGILPKPNIRFQKGKQWVLEMVMNDEFIEAKKKTRFAQLIEGTQYSEYAIENQFLRDNDTFIEMRPPKASYRGAIKYNGFTYGMWVSLNNGLIYISEKANEDGGKVYCITKEDHTPNTLLLKAQMGLPMLKLLKEAFAYGLVRFDTMKTKNQMYEVYGLLSVR